MEKIYGMCCLISNNPTSFSTDVIPMVTHNGQIDMEKTITNAEAICILLNGSVLCEAHRPLHPLESGEKGADCFLNAFDTIHEKDEN